MGKHDRSGKPSQGGQGGQDWGGNFRGKGKPKSFNPGPRGGTDADSAAQARRGQQGFGEEKKFAKDRSFPTARDAACQQVLRGGMGTLGLEPESASGQALLKDLDTYLKEIELWNPKLGLVEAGGRELIVKHVLDSLAPWRLFLDSAAQAPRLDGTLKLADLGTGGGFPALPLALVLKHYADFAWVMDLFDRQARRTEFLQNSVVFLGLKDRVKVNQTLLEGMDKPAGQTGDLRDTRKASPLDGVYSLITARAFRPLDRQVLPAMQDMLAPSGRLFLYKGRRDSIQEELERVGLGNAEAAPAGCQVQVLPVEVPGLGDERHIVLIGKN